MEFQGPTNEYLLLTEVTAANCHFLKQRIPSALSLLWMDDGNTQLKIDGKEYTFRRHEVVCLTEFHRVEVIRIMNLRLVRFNRPFFCVIDHDSEVGCKGILFFGASQLPVFRIPDVEQEKFDILWKMFSMEMQSADALQIEMLQIMLKRLLILSTRIYKIQKMGGADQQNGDINLVREFNYLVEQHFKTKHTVAEYAGLLHKSPKTLSNVFARHGNGKTSLSKKEKELVNLVVSQENGCRYCQSAHTVLGKMNGFTDDQLLEIRGGSAAFDPKLDALARLTLEITARRGRPSEETLSRFFAAGYTKGSLVDVVIAIADKVVMNYLHNITQIPIDFPLAPELEAVAA